VGREIGVDGAAALELLPGGERAKVSATTGRDSDGPAFLPIEPGTVIARALETGEPVLAADLEDGSPYRASEIERLAGVRSVAAVVIEGRDRPYGVIGGMAQRPHHFQPEDANFLRALANVRADAVERRRAVAAIAEISAARGRLVGQAIDAEDNARRAISEALHDGALQELVVARNELYTLTGRGGDDAALEHAQERLGAILAHLREVMSALHPTVLHYGGLDAALHAVAEQEGGTGGFEAHVSIDEEAIGVRDELVLALARELLTNAARHAAATRVEIAVRREAGAVELRVDDDGAGFAPGRLEAALAAGAIGLASCRERLEALGGTLAVQSAPGTGTRVSARIPLAAAAPTHRTSRVTG
jgi:two-component system NarL family sensor kinase